MTRGRLWQSMAVLVRLVVLVCCGFVVGVTPGMGRGTTAASIGPRHVSAVRSLTQTLVFYETATNDRARLLAHLDLATQLAPTGFYVTAEGELERSGDHRSIADLAHARAVKVYPVVQNYRDGAFHGEDLGWLASPLERRAMCAALLRAVSDAHADGIDLDLEELPQVLRPDFTSFVGELSAWFHLAGDRVLVDLPVDHAAYDAAQLARSSDWLVLMAYDQHSLAGQPGPIAGRPWVDAALAQTTREVPASRLILGLVGYGYDWTPGSVQPLSYREVLRRAGTAGVIRWDEASSEPWFEYADSNGTRHTVWFSDAPSLQPLVAEARAAGLAGVSLWRLGLEDPATWDVLGRHARRANPSRALASVSIDPIRQGTGELAALPRTSQDGRRALTWDPTGRWVTGERYLSLPRPEQILESGLRPGTVALTFDDGPDPAWTPQVLDILKRYHARATFFVIGRQAAAHPELVARMYAEGNEVGNHTFTHAADLESAPSWRFRLELSLTQRVIEGATGHSATLFRYPYMGSLTDLDQPDQPLVRRAAEEGYRLVGQSTDTLDWARPGAALIAGRALDDPAGKIILLHDGGGNRAQTVAALPFILESLHHLGLQILPVSEAAGGGQRTTAMPPASASAEPMDMTVLGTGWLVAHGSDLWLLLVNAVVLFAFARLLALGLFGFLHWRKRPGWHRSPYRGRVSVVVPAHDEERVIGATIEALLRSDHPHLEVIVVDDGSTDGTAERVSAFQDRGVRLIRQPNAGKAAALRRGFAAARHPIVVALDADTLFTASTVRHLIAPFSDVRVGAVAGNPKVGNRVNLVTRLQVLEYVLTLNLERRAYALLGCVAVVPGAAGAWRRSAVLEAGGFSGETLAEDTDLTLTLGRMGYRVEYAPRAVAYTEAPQTLRGLARQRSRWAFGILQCLWKHRRGLLSARARAFGLVAIPGLGLSAVVMPLIAPTIDLGLVLALALGASRVLVATIAYNASLVALSAWALAADHEPARLALLTPLQNLFYRQFQYVVALHAAVRAVRGMRVGWTRVARLGTSTVRSGAT